MRKFIDTALLAIIGTIIAVALLSSVYFFLETRRAETQVPAITVEHLDPVVNTYEIDAGVFICEHYSNGDMVCVAQDDPDVGGGRIQP
jgi:hypothetical protein